MAYLGTWLKEHNVFTERVDELWAKHWGQSYAHIIAAILLYGY